MELNEVPYRLTELVPEQVRVPPAELLPVALRVPERAQQPPEGGLRQAPQEERRSGCTLQARSPSQARQAYSVTSFW